MLLKVGDLARRCGLTVRTLHHYDAIGLLRPSARADNGYRLYNRSDIARLHQIQALRRFGLSLAEIGRVLADPAKQLSPIVNQQIEALDRQIRQAERLRTRLARLGAQLKRGEEPELTDWLVTLEMMNMYDNYFSPSELARLPLLNEGTDSTAAEWAELVQTVRSAMDGGARVEDPAVQGLAKRWMQMVVRDTGGDPRLFVKLNLMHFKEASVQTKSGITPELMQFVVAAFNESRFAIYEKYLSPEEMSFMRANYGRRGDEWPPLLAAIRQLMEERVAPTDPPMLRLAAQWLDLHRSFAGDDPQTHAKFAAAHAAEPELLVGSFVTQEMLAYILPALARLRGE